MIYKEVATFRLSVARLAQLEKAKKLGLRALEGWRDTRHAFQLWQAHRTWGHLWGFGCAWWKAYTSDRAFNRMYKKLYSRKVSNV